MSLWRELITQSEAVKVQHYWREFLAELEFVPTKLESECQLCLSTTLYSMARLNILEHNVMFFAQNNKLNEHLIILPTLPFQK